MSKIIAIANPKGGTAKTSTVVNLAGALAIAGRRILIGDLDAQGSATVGLNFKRVADCPLAAAMINDTYLSPAKVMHYEKGSIDLIPAGDDFNAVQPLLYQKAGSLLRLKKALSEVSRSYDLTLLDCPPGLGFITQSALCAADYLIIPTHCEMMSLVSASSLIEEASKLKNSGFSSIQILGMLRTMIDADDGSETFEQTCNELKDLGPRVFNAVIPFSSRISESQAMGKPIIYYDRTSLGARAYLSFAGECLAALEELSGQKRS